MIEPSLYERCSFINQENVTLFDYAAFFSSVKCFKYLLMNNSNVNNTGKYAVAGGNEEIIHLCEQNHSSFEGAYETANMFHRNDIFKYICDNKLEGINKLELGKKCILYDNYELYTFFKNKKIKIRSSLINTSIETGNLYIAQYLLKIKPIQIDFYKISTICGNKELFDFLLNNKYINITPQNMNETSLIKASEKGGKALVNFLLEQKSININAKDNKGRSALLLALQKEHFDVAELLLAQKRIDINDRDNYWGQTALIFASQNGYTRIVKILLNLEKVKINTKDKNENTALMLATKYGHTVIVKLLLD